MKSTIGYQLDWNVRMQIIYRKLQSHDAKDFRRVRLEGLKNYPENFGSTYEDEAEKEKLLLEEMIQQDLTDNFCFGAFAKDDLIGRDRISRLRVIVDNPSAGKLDKKIGFETFGLQKNYFKIGDKYWNLQLMQLSKVYIM